MASEKMYNKLIAGRTWRNCCSAMFTAEILELDG
jgi:hypothetical protein